MSVQHLVEEKLEEKFGCKSLIMKYHIVKDESVLFVKTEFNSFYPAN